MVMTRAQLIEQHRLLMKEKSLLIEEISKKLDPIVNYVPRIDALVRENIRLEHSEAAAILKARRFENLAGEHLITIQQLNAENERLQRRIEELERLREDTRPVKKRPVKKRGVKKSKVSKP